MNIWLHLCFSFLIFKGYLVLNYGNFKAICYDMKICIAKPPRKHYRTEQNKKSFRIILRPVTSGIYIHVAQPYLVKYYQLYSNLQFDFWFCPSLANNFITKTYLYNFDPCKSHFYIVKLGFRGVCIIFLISAQKTDCGYSLELPCRGSSNEYPQSIFWAKLWKNIRIFYLKSQFLVVKYSIYLNRHVFVMICEVGFSSEYASNGTWVLCLWLYGDPWYSTKTLKAYILKILKEEIFKWQLKH